MRATAQTTARVVAVYGFRDAGGYGIRGWRAHCDKCSMLSNLYTHIGSAHKKAHDHRCDA